MTTEAAVPHMLGEATIAELEHNLSGRLIRPGDESYDEARAIWNGAHDRRPAMIVRCAGVADVMQAVDFARSEDLPVAVRGGGHSIPGFSTVDGGVGIDLSEMTAGHVGPARPAPAARGGAARGGVAPQTRGLRVPRAGGPPWG